MKTSIEVLLDDQGRISIPPPLQNRLGLSPGMSLVVEEEENGELWLRLQSELPTLVDKQGVLVVRAKAVGEV
jgi:bifunctional DNA-binding transcriptional regulator/antitoxin component of YhaV-PrlF toxin-antitoxin module